MPAKVPFRVIHVSGQDENFRASELNTHSPTTKGWQSSRFCLYPQDIVVQLENRAKLKKIQILSHQFLIATKIEFYIGDVPDGIPTILQNARYTRLGYVALSDNEKTGYKARELKSVHVDANGVFVKFVIHKNHINKHNMFNQVGIIALNIIGDEIEKDKRHEKIFDDENVDASEDNRNISRPDYISPLDDLAFDMYQDPEVAQIIRRLEHKKQEAVLQERYDYAKKLKSATQDLQKVGEKLGKYEVEKRQAVENEDYDKAKLKKVQMDEYRLQVYKQLELYDLLEMYGSRSPNPPIDLGPTRQPTPPRLSQITPQPDKTQKYQTPTPRTPYDDRPLPAIKKKITVPPEDEEGAYPTPKTPHDNRSLPPSKNRLTDQEPPEEEEDIDQSGNVTGEPEPMSEKDQREANVVIETFGLQLVSKAYSKTWSFREDALLEVYKEMKEMPLTTPRGDSQASIRAALILITKAINDKVKSVYTAGLNLLKFILTEFSKSHKIPKGDISTVVERVLPTLLQRTADTAPRIRDAAKDFIIECSNFPEVKAIHVVPQECLKPFKLSISPRLALSRTELVYSLYKENGLSNSGLSVKGMMEFCTQALEHTAGEVREKAEEIIIELYREVKAPVKSHLPPDDERTRRNVLYKKLFEAFDKIDGKPSKQDIKKQKADAETAKQKEIEQLQTQLQQLKDMNAGKVDKTKAKTKPKPKSTSAADDVPDDASIPIDQTSSEDSEVNKRMMILNRAQQRKAGSSQPSTPRKTNDKLQNGVKGKLKAPPKTGDALDDPIQCTCIFCGEKNEKFTDEGLDLHYWKSCPMLQRCTQCKQVVEISGLTDHLLTECDKKDQFKKCPRCTEAIIESDYSQHIADKACPPADATKDHCPMCHLNIPQSEEAWKEHLMGERGCKVNPRRLPALKAAKEAKSKSSKQPAKVTPGRVPRK